MTKSILPKFTKLNTLKDEQKQSDSDLYVEETKYYLWKNIGNSPFRGNAP